MSTLGTGIAICSLESFSVIFLSSVQDNSTRIHGKLHPMIAIITVGDCELLVLRRVTWHLCKFLVVTSCTEPDFLQICLPKLGTVLGEWCPRAAGISLSYGDATD